ncbi:hypothetical protein [Streptomyces puniciscabiei]|nr:hypothetical protein [Streptomyces puniciscabiei]
MGDAGSDRQPPVLAEEPPVLAEEPAAVCPAEVPAVVDVTADEEGVRVAFAVPLFAVALFCVQLVRRTTAAAAVPRAAPRYRERFRRVISKEPLLIRPDSPEMP